MNSYAEIGDTIVFKKPYLQEVINEAVKFGAKVGVQEYQISKMKETDITVKDTSKILGVSSPTIIKYIQTGKKGVKLEATKHGSTYRINKYDLHQFRQKIK